MKAFLLLALTSFLALSPIPPSGARAATMPVEPADDGACDADALPPPEEACGDALLCSARERVTIACDLRRVLEARYVFFPVKARMLGSPGRPAFDVRRHLDACVADEAARPIEDEPLRFYDRMRRCTAAFEDGHLLMRVPGGVPQVALGVALRRAADGKVYVAGRARRLLDSLERTAGAAGAGALLVPGAEVVEIDGRPVAAAMAEMAAHVPGSSAAARLERAVDALTRRDFAFPERRSATLTIADRGTRQQVELPWWIAPTAEKSPAARAYVRRTGIPTTDLVDWRPPRAAWAGAPVAGEGVRRGDAVLDPDAARALLEYTGEDGFVAARLGEAPRGGAPVCYAQFLSFHTETLSRGGDRRAFKAVVEEFVRGCNERGRDLVVDLRQNDGGYLAHSTAVAEMLLPPDAVAPGGALVLRATAYNERVYRDKAPMLGGAPGEAARGPSEPERVLESIRTARDAREDFTRAFLEAPLRPNPAVGGFGGRVVALVTPSCMSACERLAGLLRNGGRATLVGGPTEGAGGSQQETKTLTARWTDDTGRLTLSIPNAAMGVQPAVPAASDDASAAWFFDALAFENRPVEPHIPYATTRDDLTGHNRGWREQVDAALARGPATAAR